jgi:hypothetical protein
MGNSITPPTQTKARIKRLSPPAHVNPRLNNSAILKAFPALEKLFSAVTRRKKDPRAVPVPATPETGPLSRQSARVTATIHPSGNHVKEDNREGHQKEKIPLGRG